MNPVYDLSFRAELPQFREFSAAVQWRALGIGVVAQPVGLGLLAALVIKVVLDCETCGLDYYSASVGVWAVLIGWMLWNVVTAFVLIPRYLRADGVVLGHRNVTADDEGVVTKGANDETRYTWAAFQSVTRHKSILILWTEPGAGLFVPLNAFTSEAAIDEFIGYATRHLSQESKT